MVSVLGLDPGGIDKSEVKTLSVGVGRGVADTRVMTSVMRKLPPAPVSTF